MIKNINDAKFDCHYPSNSDGLQKKTLNPIVLNEG